MRKRIVGKGRKKVEEKELSYFVGSRRWESKFYIFFPICGRVIILYGTYKHNIIQEFLVSIILVHG